MSGQDTTTASATVRTHVSEGLVRVELEGLEPGVAEAVNVSDASGMPGQWAMTRMEPVYGVNLMTRLFAVLAKIGCQQLSVRPTTDDEGMRLRAYYAQHGFVDGGAGKLIWWPKSDSAAA